MTSSSLIGALVFNLKIDRTTKANRKTERQEDNPQSSLNLSANLKKEPKVQVPNIKDMDEHGTLKELATPKMN
jgi:hypothetical protein